VGGVGGGGVVGGLGGGVGVGVVRLFVLGVICFTCGGGVCLVGVGGGWGGLGGGGGWTRGGGERAVTWKNVSCLKTDY